MNRLLLVKAGIPVLLVLFLVLSLTNSDQVHLTGQTMGTTYNVKYVDVSELTTEQMQQQIDSLLVTVNKQMSTYDPESELSRFNRQQSTEPFAVSMDTAKVVTEAIRLGQMSDGVLDVTVGPLVNLWGFGPKARPEKVPSEQTIEQTKALTGLDKLTVTGSTIIKSQPDLYVDLSTIAKGFGVDKIAELFAEHGITDYLIEIGGEMRMSGRKVDDHPWLIAVEKPVSEERAVQRVMVVGNNAVATSGDYRNYFEQDGVRYSHLIDPRTGYPIQHNTVAVTVVHPSSMTADGLATALIVMGKEQALALAEEQGIAVMLITRENGEFKEYTSGAFAQAVQIVQ